MPEKLFSGAYFYIFSGGINCVSFYLGSGAASVDKPYPQAEERNFWSCSS